MQHNFFPVIIGQACIETVGSSCNTKIFQIFWFWLHPFLPCCWCQSRVIFLLDLNHLNREYTNGVSSNKMQDLSYLTLLVISGSDIAYASPHHSHNILVKTPLNQVQSDKSYLNFYYSSKPQVRVWHLDPNLSKYLKPPSLNLQVDAGVVVELKQKAAIWMQGSSGTDRHRELWEIFAAIDCLKSEAYHMSGTEQWSWLRELARKHHSIYLTVTVGTLLRRFLAL